MSVENKVILVDPKEFTATVLKDVDATNDLSIKVVNGVVQIVDDGVIVDSEPANFAAWDDAFFEVLGLGQRDVSRQLEFFVADVKFTQ